MLRRSRREQGLTLRQAGEQSSHRFRPSTLGSYERGERSISVEAFCDLARLYKVPPDQLLARALKEANPSGRGELVVDLNRLALLEERERRLLAEFVHNIRSEREDYLSEMITLRSGDVETMALDLGMKSSALLERLQAAVTRRA